MKILQVDKVRSSRGKESKWLLRRGKVRKFLEGSCAHPQVLTCEEDPGEREKALAHHRPVISQMANVKGVMGLKNCH